MESIKAELATASATLEGMESRISMAFGFGISDEQTLTSMILAATEEEANSIAIDKKEDVESIEASDGGVVSDAQAYKQFGNSVAVPAIQATTEKIIEKLNCK